MSTADTPQPQPEPEGLGERLAAFANWFNEYVLGSPWTYLACLAVVLLVYAFVPVQGYGKWNLTTGLFFNTTSSSIELITGVGAVVGVYAVRRQQRKHHGQVQELHDAHREDIEALSAKIDGLAAAVRAAQLPVPAPVPARTAKGK